MNRLLTTVMVGLAGIQGITLEAASRPKLVVGIVVDQLRDDYLENLRDMFGTGGFRRLMEDGVYIKDLDYGVLPADATAATAIVQTGTYPRYNGITGERVYDPPTKTFNSIFQDSNYIGNFTTETYSPASLRVSTLTDEISIDSKGNARVHSIAPDASQAIVLAGHTGQSAFWINDETGKWSSTTYYNNPPVQLQNKNYSEPLVSRLDTMRWEPLRKGEPYPDITSQVIKDGFRYSFSRSDKDVYENYKSSPFINSDITQAASQYVSELNLGKDAETTDVVNIGLTLAPYPAASEDYKYSLEDAYLRLDKDLEKLFTSLDRQVGKENVLIYLVSTGYFNEPEINTGNYRIPGGTFSVKRAMSLLNSYLAAKYGNGAYVARYVDKNIFLNKPLIEEKNLDLSQLAIEARDFMMRISGIEEAYTQGDLVSPTLPELNAIRLSQDPKISGDIVLKFNPGWNVVDDTRFPQETQKHSTAVYPAPAFISYSGLEPQVITEKVEAVSLAPTIANTLRIRAPNSTSTKPLSINKK